MGTSNMNSLNTYQVGESYVVHVTHINDPHSFYVRRIVFDDTLEPLEAWGAQLEMLQPLYPVVYKSETLNKYVRGVTSAVCKSDDMKCDVHAIDYGCVDQCVPIYHIWNRAQDVDAPPLATHCELHMCAPKEATFSQEAIDAMKYYVGKEVSKMTVKGIDIITDKLVVQLVNSCPDDIATIMALTHFTVLFAHVPAACASIVNRKPTFSYKPKDVKVGDVLHVRVQSGDDVSAFYVAQINDHREYLKNQTDFTYYYLTDPGVEQVQIGESVGVICPDRSKYERGIVKEVLVPGCRALVYLIDLGKNIDVGFMYIRALTKSFTTAQPAVALFCSTDQRQTWNNNLHRFLYPGYEFKIRIMNVGDGWKVPHTVDLIKL